ncbi:TPA: outer membrane usher protein PefC, partial [Escherichia coli]|nr:outer membrane usher protein PefC [Escherichia coli]
FDFDNIIRYILRLKDKKGNYLSGGEATTVHGVNAGFISGNGILLMSLLTEPKAILVNTGNGKECSFSTNGLEQNTNKVQEVICD